MTTHPHLNTLIIGSGASGLAAAVFLHRLGVKDIAIYTEGLQHGTSLNAGSDKQTYYKLGLYGAEPDAPVLMANDLSAGGAMHGDIALIEAAASPLTFANLVHLGVPFPHDEFGQYIGYKTDHDPKRRATSCGPYTSREMCLALTAEAKRLNIPIRENRIAIELLTDRNRCRAIGAIFVNTAKSALAGQCFETVQAENIIFATGGPGGMYADSVYPVQHTGSIGLALEVGAQAANLAESQFGLASTNFRWNVSGSYMQVLPRFISVDDQGVTREFLRDYFPSLPDLLNAVFLKGYQWPFAAGHVPGSSLIDIFVYVESMERGRQVFLDYRSDPPDFDFNALNQETRDYLTKSGAHLGKTPLQRLVALNAPAISLYRDHGIDLATEPLPIAVCAQHNNGGLAADLNWESPNLKHFFPIGEVCGTHGVTRPGGSALNSGQVGAWRAAQAIALKYQGKTINDADFLAQAKESHQRLSQPELMATPASPDWTQDRLILQQRMSRAGAFVRTRETAIQARDEARKQFSAVSNCNLTTLANAVDIAETIRNRQFCLAQVYYLTAIIEQIENMGSRGGAIVLDPKNGNHIHPALPPHWRLKPENAAWRQKVMLCQSDPDGNPVIAWQDCRPVPCPDGWFETVWKSFRESRQSL
ncbi:MAG: Fumarate reductase flavoprotein subunit [Lentisphaerae bacterium ADurb.Bin082]|nr:MAG: Fumarate reductase flavoprotein subunit [Lentisphaerae bacterium ADurb.Bin082]